MMLPSNDELSQDLGRAAGRLRGRPFVGCLAMTGIMVVTVFLGRRGRSQVLDEERKNPLDISCANKYRYKVV